MSFTPSSLPEVIWMPWETYLHMHLKFLATGKVLLEDVCCKWSSQEDCQLPFVCSDPCPSIFDFHKKPLWNNPVFMLSSYKWLHKWTWPVVWIANVRSECNQQMLTMHPFFSTFFVIFTCMPSSTDTVLVPVSSDKSRALAFVCVPNLPKSTWD